MKVRFVRTGGSGYAVMVAPVGAPPGAMDPADVERVVTRLDIVPTPVAAQNGGTP